MTGDMITLACLTLFVLGVTIGILRANARSRRYEAIVRDWARKNDYAIITITPQGRLFDYILLLLLGPVGLIPGLFLKIGPYGFRLLIQDEQDAQTTISVYVTNPNKPVEVRWEYEEPPIDPRRFF